MIEYWKNKSLESLFYIDEKGLVCLEEWRDIPNYVGRYKSSNLGRVMSIFGKRKGKSNCYVKIPVKILAQAINKHNRPHLTLSNDKGRKNWIVANLISLTFKGHITKGYSKITDHKNNIPYDNRLFNLQIITTRKNTSKDKKPKTGKTGVYKRLDSKYYASIRYKNKTYRLGSYSTIKKASLAREKVVKIIEKQGDISKYIKTQTNKNNYKGVVNRKNRFRASIVINKKRIHIGTFDTEKEAGEAYLNFKNKKNEH